jgi:putative DNA primase/helicase
VPRCWLAARNDAPVLICEGEKSADAAALIFPDYVCVTSPGGCKAGHKADWTPLAGRSATIWPDRKRPSERKYAQTVAEILRGLRCDLALIDADAAASVAPDATDRMASLSDGKIRRATRMSGQFRNRF